ncbi:hypothetical protein FA95DRAFT_1388428 [Auriscalpium vulgare]|uniref:Uncharacterized protein n=1 Tax=Auriscalpium vulgare TaxID=40419 RepID=A0ACB8S8T9_9AGAM|nr:hypothetical protein FA95DRAFT_1388428 [Auriscalpium vulgare]
MARPARKSSLITSRQLCFVFAYVPFEPCPASLPSVMSPAHQCLRRQLGPLLVSAPPRLEFCLTRRWSFLTARPTGRLAIWDIEHPSKPTPGPDILREPFVLSLRTISIATLGGPRGPSGGSYFGSYHFDLSSYVQ